MYRPSCSLAAILLLASAGSHECPLPSCTFSARHLQVTVNFGRGLQVVFLHSVTSLVSAPSTSVFHASLAAWRFAITSMMIHILQLSSHCLRIQPLHPHRASGQPPLVVFQKDPAVAGCACVCVGNFWPEVNPLLLLFFQPWHGPTRTHPSCCANAPAIVESWWDVTNPRTTMPFFNENHFRIWIRHMNGWRWLLIYLSAPLVQSETAVIFLSIPIFCLYCRILRGFFWFYSFLQGGDEGKYSTPNPPVRWNWSVFARQMRSTSKFDKTSLSKCVCVCACACVYV